MNKKVGHSKSEKASGKHQANQDATQLRFNSASVFERIIRQENAKNILSETWQVNRKLVIPDEPMPKLSEDQLASWPAKRPPSVSLTPKAGYSVTLGRRGPAHTVVIGTFGADEERLQKIIKQIQDLQAGEQGFHPLFLTDCPHHTPFRLAGYNFEYFPSHVYGGMEQSELFGERFRTIWRKWNTASMIDLGVPSFLRARLEEYDTLLKIEDGETPTFSPRKTRPKVRSAVVADLAALKAEYLSKGLDTQPDTFVLYRIIGNDLPPRHKSGQALENLRFILENEAELEHCSKRWIVNRIIDRTQLRAIVRLLKKHHQLFQIIPFHMHEYRDAEWKLDDFPEPGFVLKGRYQDMEHDDQLRAEAHMRSAKTLYVANNNGARNVALNEGRELAKWVLPWDGNCFLTRDAWRKVREAIVDRPYLKYFCVPMARFANNRQLVKKAFEAAAAIEEPQIVFRRDVDEVFDERIPYGRRPKVELLWRLGVPGPWDEWVDDIWDRPRPKRSKDAGAFGQAGWVAKLQSGRAGIEVDGQESLIERARARIEALIGLSNELDVQGLDQDTERLTAYNLDAIIALAHAQPDTNMAYLYQRLLQEAALAAQRGPYSVVDKKALPPSEDKQDYFHPPPYWWPDPDSPDGLPGLWKDGKRAPAAELYSEESDDYDRTRLQRMFDDTMVLALAGTSSENTDFHAHAALLVHHWFLDPKTRMNPHLLFAQLLPGGDTDQGSSRGLIEMKDMYFFLDAVRLLRKSSAISKAQDSAFREWLEEYLEWLLTSPQGEEERRSSNNHGTCYDLQVAAIAAYLGKKEILVETFRYSRMRISGQFGRYGEQNHELNRTLTLHYCAFNLQCWYHLANLAEACGDRLWDYETSDGRNLALAITWFLSNSRNDHWPYRQIGRFDADRLLPLILNAQAMFTGIDSVAEANQCLRKPVYFPHNGIMPFWMLSQGLRAMAKDAPSELISTVRNKVGTVAKMCREGSRTKLTSSDLDERLWRGYARYAMGELETISAAVGAKESDCEIASWARARWHGGFGRWDEALAALRDVDPGRRQAKKELVLLEADCLIRAGQGEQARALVSTALEQRPEDATLLLAMANSFIQETGEDRAEIDEMRLSWFNKVYFGNGLAMIEKRDRSKPLSFFNLSSQRSDIGWISQKQQPKVSVIIPVYNGSETIAVALRSLTEQSWSNLQIIVSDDASTDATCEIVQEYMRQDPRVELVTARQNGGAYTARNSGLTQATGEFVTVHDADDWSHPKKIELQMSDLLRRDDRSAVVTIWGRVDHNLYVLSNWRPVATLFSTNHSSLMMRRAALEELGPWDRVRIGADMELLSRFNHRFGSRAMHTVFPRLPLSLSLERSEALTKTEATHVRTVYHGVRLEYRRSYKRWHEKVLARGDELHLPAEGERSFPAPRLILPDREKCPEYRTLYLGDFSTGAFGIKDSVALISQAAEHQSHLALLHWPDYEGDLTEDLHPEIGTLLDELRLEQVGALEAAKADRLVLLDPYLARYQIEGVSQLQADELLVVCRDAGAKEVIFDQRRRRMPTRGELAEMFDMPCRWVWFDHFRAEMSGQVPKSENP